MIDKIKIKNVATYDEDGITIENIEKINYIYGANGCGKTTISRLLSNPAEDEFSECEIIWNNEIALKTFVYNREFREKNFAESDIAGIFTLGQDSTEQVIDINEKKKELDELKKNIIATNKTLNGLNEKISNENNEFKEVLWQDVYKNNEVKFKNAFTGFLKKDSFAKKLQSYCVSDEDILNRIDIENRAETLLGKQPVKLNLYHKIDGEEILELETAEIWGKCISGKADIPIAKLIEYLGNGDWVNQGRKYMKKDSMCPFCQKNTIDETFKAQLEMFFDEEFEKDVQSVRSHKIKYEEQVEKVIESVTLLIEQGLNKIEGNPVANILESLKNCFKLNLGLIDEKIKEPGRKVEIRSISSYLDEINNIIQKKNEEISKHNNLVDNFKTEKEKLISDVWMLLAKENSEIIKNHKNKVAGFNSGIQSTTSKKSQYEKAKEDLENEIKEKSKHVTSVQPAVDEMNRLLAMETIPKEGFIIGF